MYCLPIEKHSVNNYIVPLQYSNITKKIVMNN